MTTKELQSAIDYINKFPKNITTMDQLSQEQINKLASLIPEKYVYPLARKLGIKNTESFHYLNVLEDVSIEDQKKCIKYMSMIEKGANPSDMPTEFMDWITNLSDKNKGHFFSKVYCFGNK